MTETREREMSAAERDMMIINIAKNTAETARILRSMRNIAAILAGTIIAVVAGNTGLSQLFSFIR